MYSVFFSTFSSVPFAIYQTCKFGVRSLDHLQANVRRDVTKRMETWTVQRIVYLTKDDKLFIHIPSISVLSVSRDLDTHIFGLFEI